MNNPIPFEPGIPSVSDDSKLPGDSLNSAPGNPTIHKTRLPNGLTLIEINQPQLRTVHITVYIRTGSRYEPPEKNGVSHFLEHMVFRGTRQYPTAFALNCAFESLGANVNGSTTPDSTEYAVSLPSQSAKVGTSLLYQMVTEPHFNEMDTERKIIAEEILEEFDEKGQCIDVDSLSRARVWHDNPLGMPITGTLDNVMGIDHETLHRWFKEYYVASNMVVCVSGNIGSEAFREYLRTQWGAIPTGSPHQCDISPGENDETPPTERFQHVHKPGSQTQLRLTFNTPGLLHPDYPAVELLLRLIDDGMSTPLHRNIFEDLALAYNIGAELEAYADTGVLNIDAQASHENIVPIVVESLRIIRDLCRGEINDVDFEKARDRTIWDLESLQDFPGALNGWYGEQELYRESLSPEAAAGRIKNVSLTDIIAVARRIFQRDHFYITTVGTQSTGQQGKLKDAVFRFAGPDFEEGQKE